MKILIAFIFLLSFHHCFSQLSDQHIRDLKRGAVTNDTSFVYSLPYKAGEKYPFVQGANSKFSHKAELSFDFQMKIGTGICAVRDGIVIATKSDSNKGGLKDEFLNDGNHVVIKHKDGSVAQYWHLKQNGVLVTVGDAVSKGQLIGYSGNTGYTAFPHLHFQLLGADGQQILPRFQTKKGILYLRPGRSYSNESSSSD